MLRKMPQRMAGSMPEVVKAVVAKLASAESSPLITSLLVVLAQLMHVNTTQFLDFLASQPAPGTCPKFTRLGPCYGSCERSRGSHPYDLACCAVPQTSMHNGSRRHQSTYHICRRHDAEGFWYSKRAPNYAEGTSDTCTEASVSEALAGGQAGTALGTVMGVWLERQIELRGFYNINLTSTALALALASRHPALAEVQARLFPRPLTAPLAAADRSTAHLPCWS